MTNEPPAWPEVTSDIAAVATPHALAAQSARQILQQGGNAIDAAVAGVITLCVVSPGQCGLGGFGGCMVAHLTNPNRMVAIDFDSCGPIAFDPELFVNQTAKKTLEGCLAVTVPAVVAGLDLARREFGTMSFKQVSAHAAQIAEEGFEFDATLKGLMDEWAAKADAESRAAYVPDGMVPAIGTRWRQPQTAKLIRMLADQGPGAFYRGEIPRTIVNHLRQHGGILGEEDFGEYRPRIVEPTRICYRGHELYTPPPPSGGITVFQILKTLELFDVPSMDPSGGEFFHTLAEAIKLSWHDRMRYLGDPDLVRIPIDQMLSIEGAQQRAAEIRSGKISGSTRQLQDSGPHTVNVSAVDKDRNVASITATLGYVFGSTVVVPELGIVLNHGMSRFDFDPPGNPNSPAPRKRMQHNMSPMIGMKDGHPRFAIGLPGGAKIIPVTARLICDAIDFRLPPGQSVTMPRIHVEANEPIEVWPNMPAQTVAELKKRGHKTKREVKIGGATNVVSLDPETGKITAADSLGKECVVAI